VKLSLAQIAQMAGAAAPDVKNLQELTAGGYSIDSRTIGPGEVFFAIRGASRDGHMFLDAAFRKGAVAAVASRGPARYAGRLLLVKDPKAALQQLAAGVRRNWGGRVAAVTGSNGKTTTKEILAALLATRFRVAKSEGNLNNDLGVPLSLLRMDDDAEAAVLELGMSHRGEIRALAAIALPDVGVVTNVNAVHLEFFHSVDEIALAKRELIESLPAGGTAVLNADDERVAGFREVSPGRVITFGIEKPAEVRAVAVEDLGPEGSRFRLEWSDVVFATPLPGRHNLYNTLAALAAARAFDIPLEPLAEAVRGLQPVHMRGQIVDIGGVRFIDDCYNSNPKAAEAMLDLLAKMPAQRRIAVLGEMLELGASSEQWHRQVGRKAAQRGIDLLLGVQGAAEALVEEAKAEGFPNGSARFFPDSRAAGEFLKTILQPGDVVLLKGSRGVRLETALEEIKGMNGQRRP
jgi:UDP-N-acetylmuramoyl-tripeptide--D-alanyl-D-alanine ligase